MPTGGALELILLHGVVRQHPFVHIKYHVSRLAGSAASYGSLGLCYHYITAANTAVQQVEPYNNPPTRSIKGVCVRAWLGAQTRMHTAVHV